MGRGAAATRVAIAGIGRTDFYKRGESWPQTKLQMAGRAILEACADAGLSVRDIDGFAFYSMMSTGLDTPQIMESLGIPEIGFSATVTSGGGGCAGAIGLAGAAILSGQAKVVVTLMCLQQVPGNRLGQGYKKSGDPNPDAAFLAPSGLTAPGPMMSVLARRHMHKYGTRREAFGEIAVSFRTNALALPEAQMKKPMTLDDYFNAPMIADPMCRNDFCLETDGAVAIITTSDERARDLKQRPVRVVGAEMGGSAEWGRAFGWMGMPDDVFASAGHGSIARKVYGKAGLGPDDIDVALLYDHFSPLVVMQLEDYGFCARGEGGPFVESGAIRYPTGSIPVNPNGGQLSHAYMGGLTLVYEGVKQMRGDAVNQVKDAELALVTGGPASLPVSAIILGR